MPRDFPKDSNGDTLRWMAEGGDDLSQPRVVEFEFLFERRDQALQFAAMVDDYRYEVCISWFGGKKSWNVTVGYNMIPTHHNITELESALTRQAASVGGTADGWGCFAVKGDGQ
jgi:hypothetical protein